MNSTQINNKQFAAIATGGALGATIRWAILTSTTKPTGFPWILFLINIAGCAALGAVVAEEWNHARAKLWLRDFAGIGFCGGLTTFSTFAVETADFMRAHRFGLAVSYTSASVVCGIMASFLAALMFRRLRTFILPLEEQP